jgi:hypothetical protein
MGKGTRKILRGLSRQGKKPSFPALLIIHDLVSSNQELIDRAGMIGIIVGNSHAYG